LAENTAVAGMAGVQTIAEADQSAAQTVINQISFLSSFPTQLKTSVADDGTITDFLCLILATIPLQELVTIYIGVPMYSWRLV